MVDITAENLLSQVNFAAYSLLPFTNKTKLCREHSALRKTKFHQIEFSPEPEKTARQKKFCEPKKDIASNDGPILFTVTRATIVITAGLTIQQESLPDLEIQSSSSLFKSSQGFLWLTLTIPFGSLLLDLHGFCKHLA